MEASFCLSSHHPSFLLKSSSFPSTHSNYRINYSFTAKGNPFNSFRRFSLSIDNGSSPPRSNVLRPITCCASFDGFPVSNKKDEGDNINKNFVIKVGAAVVLACALGMSMCSGTAKAMPSGIQKLMTMNNMCKNSSQGGGGNEIQYPTFPTIKREAKARADKGDVEGAVKYLNEHYSNYKDYKQESYLIEMLLVEMLIRQGKYTNALERKCLSDEDQPKGSPVADKRILYNTFLYSITDNHDQAKIWCKKLLKQLEQKVNDAGHKTGGPGQKSTEPNLMSFVDDDDADDSTDD